MQCIIKVTQKLIKLTHYDETKKRAAYDSQVVRARENLKLSQAYRLSRDTYICCILRFIRFSYLN